MAVSYGFFDSVSGDRTYNADQISEYFLKLISNGVFATPSNSMQVQAASGMTVNITAGWGFINCKWVKNDSAFGLTLDAADLALNRIDRIVMRLVPASRKIEFDIVKGTPAASPAPPTLTRIAGGIWELSLAKIAVNANATAITQADITDERGNTSVCGYITGLINQIDTTNLFAQYDTAFNTWFDSIKDQVKQTTLVTGFSSRYVTTQASESTIPINISAYSATLDILNVYVNGMRLKSGTDYTVSGTNVVLTAALDVIGTPVDFEVIKSVDSENAASFVSLLSQLMNDVQFLSNCLGGLAFMKLTQEEYDQIETPLDNVVYIIVEDSE